MLALIQYNGVMLAICVALGLATGWWMFRGDVPQLQDKDGR